MRIEVIVSLRVLVKIICRLVGPPSEMAHGTVLDLLLEYTPSEEVSLVGGRI